MPTNLKLTQLDLMDFWVASFLVDVVVSEYKRWT